MSLEARTIFVYQEEEDEGEQEKKKSYEILITCIDFGNLSYGFHGKERAYQLIEIMIQL